MRADNEMKSEDHSGFLKPSRVVTSACRIGAEKRKETIETRNSMRAGMSKVVRTVVKLMVDAMAVRVEGSPREADWVSQ